MNLSDPIADMLTRIRNAHRVGHFEVSIPGSKIKADIANVLKEQGYLSEVAVEKDGPKSTIKLTLKYFKREPVITGVKRVSRPSRRVYVGVNEIPRVRGGLGIAILSTPAGVISGKQAKQQNVGGELLCLIW